MFGKRLAFLGNSPYEQVQYNVLGHSVKYQGVANGLENLQHRLAVTC